MNKFTVRYYVATDWSLFTQADHYDEVIFTTGRTLAQLAHDLAKDGFAEPGGKKWIMPGAIVSITLQEGAK